MSYQKICLLETDYLAPMLQLVLAFARRKRQHEGSQGTRQFDSRQLLRPALAGLLLWPKAASTSIHVPLPKASSFCSPLRQYSPTPLHQKSMHLTNNPLRSQTIAGSAYTSGY